MLLLGVLAAFLVRSRGMFVRIFGVHMRFFRMLGSLVVLALGMMFCSGSMGFSRGLVLLGGFGVSFVGQRFLHCILDWPP